MKNLFRLFGIIALLSIIGFSMTACGNGSTSAPLTITVETTTGSLIVSGLGSHNGKWILAVGKDPSPSPSLFAANAATSSTITGALISGGTATLKVWNLTGSEENPTFANYSGNDTVSLGFGIISKATISKDEFAALMKGEGATPAWLVGWWRYC